jgi:acyl-coenzyme A synthetase/AMP-(fatty) acid ligase
MFGSPALIRRIGRYGEEHGTRLPSLKRAISAGAPVPAAVLKQFVKMLNPGVEVFTPYGATEALPVCSIGSQVILDETSQATDRGRGVCVGFPVPGIQLEIIRIDDQQISFWEDDLLVADGEIGEIVVKGGQVTQSYFNRPESNRLAKINCSDGDFFHRMGDLGYRDEQGRIWFCGRKAQRVITVEETLFTIPCEAIFNTHPQLYRSALVGIGEVDKQQPVLCVELEEQLSPQGQQVLLDQLKQIGQANPLTKNIHDFLIHPGFPVDIRHNAKIFREKLVIWAAEQFQ